MISIKAQTQAARYTRKLRKAAEEFDKVAAYSESLVRRLSIHTNGNPNEPLRKLEVFVEHNSVDELVQIGLMSEQAFRLRKQDGIKREICHLVPLNRGSQVKKVNNVSNLAVLAKTTNQIINKRAVTPQGAYAIDFLVLKGNLEEARVLADICTY
jgi:hypothetical protein